MTVPDPFTCPVCHKLLTGADYEQDRPPLVPPHEVETIEGFDRRYDGHHPIIRRTICPMSGEPIPTQEVTT